MAKNYNRDEKLRIKAIELYNENWRVTEISKAVNRSQRWFYKWLKRYRSNDPEWYKEESRRPKKSKSQKELEIEKLVLKTRKDLESTKFMQIGPKAIYYKLIADKEETTPEWKIARILQKNKVTKRKYNESYVTKGVKYPYEYLLSHQMDFVGPRYLRSKDKFYFLDIICCDTHYGQADLYDNYGADGVCQSLIKFWKSVGKPDYLQMDNDLSFWGSLYRPTSFGKVIRLCLLHEITPVFIPLSEPWRNAKIEHFNNTMQKAVLNLKNFENLREIQETADEFCQIHNRYHRYKSQNGMTPLECMNHLNYPLRPLNEDYQMPKGKLPLSSGEIHIIRFIRSDLKFRIFGLSFDLPEDMIYQYIKGVILTEEHMLKLYSDDKLINYFRLKIF